MRLSLAPVQPSYRALAPVEPSFFEPLEGCSQEASKAKVCCSSIVFLLEAKSHGTRKHKPHMNSLKLAICEVSSQLLLAGHLIPQFLSLEFHLQTKNILSHYLN
jgi:hypothetical protein